MGAQAGKSTEDLPPPASADASPWRDVSTEADTPPMRPAVPGGPVTPSPETMKVAPPPSSWAAKTDRAAGTLRPIDLVQAYSQAAAASSATPRPAKEKPSDVSSIWDDVRKGAPAKSEKGEERRREAAALRDEAYKQFSDGDLKQAAETYGRAIRLEPDSASAHAGRGGAMLRNGDAKGALKDLNEALRLDPKNMFALRDRAEARKETKDLQGAMADYNTKLTLAPADGRSFCGRGDTKLLLGDKAGAIADYEVAVGMAYPGAKALLEDAKRK